MFQETAYKEKIHVEVKICTFCSCFQWFSKYEVISFIYFQIIWRFVKFQSLDFWKIFIKKVYFRERNLLVISSDTVALVERKLGHSEKWGRDEWGEESRIKAKGKGRFVYLIICSNFCARISRLALFFTFYLYTLGKTVNETRPDRLRLKRDFQNRL